MIYDPWSSLHFMLPLLTLQICMRGRRARDRMTVGFTTTCNCISPLQLWVWTLFKARCTRCNSMWWSMSVTAAVWWFFPVSSTNKTGHQDITEILWNGEHHQLNPYNWLLGWVLYFYIHNSMCRYTLINYWLTLTSSFNKPEVAQTEEICTINRACSPFWHGSGLHGPTIYKNKTEHINLQTQLINLYVFALVQVVIICRYSDTSVNTI